VATALASPTARLTEGCRPASGAWAPALGLV